MFRSVLFVVAALASVAHAGPRVVYRFESSTGDWMIAGFPNFVVVGGGGGYARFSQGGTLGHGDASFTTARSGIGFSRNAESTLRPVDFQFEVPATLESLIDQIIAQDDFTGSDFRPTWHYCPPRNCEYVQSDIQSIEKIDWPVHDITLDGVVDASDAAVLFRWWGSPWIDLTGDGLSDAADAGVVFANWSGDAAVMAVPEPSFTLLAGLLTLLSLSVSYRPY